MNFDELQSKWQAHDHVKQVNIDSDQLLKDVVQNYRSLESQLWRRDVGEIATAALLTFVFATLAILMHEASLFLCAAGCLFVGLFLFWHRRKQQRSRSVVEDSLQSTIDASITQVQQQIWLLRNILWWYLLPLVPGIVLLLASASRQSIGNGIAEQAVIAAVGLICAAGFWHAYRINLREVKNTLEPRRKELEELRASLSASRPAS